MSCVVSVFTCVSGAAVSSSEQQEEVEQLHSLTGHHSPPHLRHEHNQNTDRSTFYTALGKLQQGEITVTMIVMLFQVLSDKWSFMKDKDKKKYGFLKDQTEKREMQKYEAKKSHRMESTTAEVFMKDEVRKERLD